VFVRQVSHTLRLLNKLTVQSWTNDDDKSKKFLLTGRCGFPIVAPDWPDAAVSLAAIVEEEADDAGGHRSALGNLPWQDVLPCVVPLPHHNPAPAARRSPRREEVTRDPTYPLRDV
jgi:hypothetical protein